MGVGVRPRSQEAAPAEAVNASAMRTHSEDDHDEVAAQQAAPAADDAQHAKRNRSATARLVAGQGGGLARRSAEPEPPPTAVEDAGIDNEAAMDVSGLLDGQLVFAKGLAPSGERVWFRAQIVRLRPGHFPPIVVKYMATEAGDEAALLLPQPRTAYVHRGDTRTLEFSEA